MVVLFAGLDSGGQVRYLDEVPSGLACECICLTCGAALVARKGRINDWHFAHQNGQQNPECLAGARNLLRQLTVQTLSERGSLPAAQPYATLIRSEYASERFTWDELEHIEAIDWMEPTGPRTAAGVQNCALPWRASPGEWPLGVTIKGSWSSPWDCPMEWRSARERLWWRASMDTMEAKWECPADQHAWYARVPAQVHAKSEAFRSTFEAVHALLALRRIETPPLATVSVARAPLNLSPAPSFAPDPTLPDWAADHKPGTSLLCYRLRDGGRWVLYESIASVYLLRQWPVPQDGWDETFPPSLGTPDQDLQAYRVQGFHQFIPAFGSYSAGTRSTSDPKAVGAQFDSLE